MGQAASYAESAIQRALLRLKTEEQRKEVEALALCGYQTPSATSAKGTNAENTRNNQRSEPRGTAQHGSTTATLTPSTDKKTAGPSENASPRPFPIAPRSWGPFVSLTPESYSIDELREALVFLPDSLVVSLNRISLLYVLDGDLDGDFGQNDIAHFTDWAIRVVPPEVSSDQLGEVVQAHAALECWHRCLVRGQQLREGNVNLVRAVGAMGGANPPRHHRDRGGQSSLLVALTMGDDLLRMAGGVSQEEAEKIAAALKAPHAPAHIPLAPIRPLQSPITRDDKLQASVHFGRWMLRMVHAQELARRQNGEQQRQRYREARRRAAQNGTHAGAGQQRAPVNGKTALGALSGHRSPTSSPSPASPSAPTPRPGAEGEPCGENGRAIGDITVSNRLEVPSDGGVPPISELSPMRPSTGTASPTGKAGDLKATRTRTVIQGRPAPPRGVILVTRKRPNKSNPVAPSTPAGARKAPPQPLVDIQPPTLHRDPNVISAGVKPEASAEHQPTPTASSQPTVEDTMHHDVFTSSDGDDTENDDDGVERGGVVQLTEQEELVIDALLAQDVEFYNKLHESGWHTVGAVEEVYLDLAVHESYGLPFWTFCRKLHEKSAREVEAALGLTPEEATRELISAVALEEARQRVALEYVQTRRRLVTDEAPANNLLLTIGDDDAEDDVVCTGTSREGSRMEPEPSPPKTAAHHPSSLVPIRPTELPTDVPPVPSFIVSRYTLLCFLHCFIKAYWDVLENMGFDPFVAEAIHAAK